MEHSHTPALPQTHTRAASGKRRCSASVVQTVLGIDDACVVPVVEGGDDDQMPPVVRVANEVHLAVEPALWNLGGIEHECHQTEQIHDHNARHHQSHQLVLQSPHGHSPVTQRQDAVRRPQQQHSDLSVHGHVQLGYLHGNGQAKHAQRNGGIQGSQKLSTR